MDCDLDEGGPIGGLLQGYSPASLQTCMGAQVSRKRSLEVGLNGVGLENTVFWNCQVQMRPGWRFVLQCSDNESSRNVNGGSLETYSTYYYLILFFL